MTYNALPLLETEHLILRPVTMNDAADIFFYSKDPRVSEFLPWTAHQSIEETRAILTRWLKAYQENKPAPWCIVDKKSRKVIGTIVADKNRPESVNGRSLYLGYCLSSDFWGKGLMVEAIKKVIEYIDKHTNATEIVAFVQPENVRSKRVLEKVGFSRSSATTTRREDVKRGWVELEKWAIEI